MSIAASLTLVLVLIILLVAQARYVERMSGPCGPRVFRYAAQPGRPVIGLIGGVHGNEPAGAVALQQLIDSGWFARTSASTGLGFIVIPRANDHGLRNGTRVTQHHTDLNRAFRENAVHLPLARDIVEAFANVDLVLDFHEGWGYHRVNSSSIGSTLSPSRTNSGLAEKLAQSATHHLNERITDPKKKFTYIPNAACDIRGLLSCYMERGGREYILMETTGQKNIQPLKLRVQQMQDAITHMISQVSSPSVL